MSESLNLPTYNVNIILGRPLIVKYTIVWFPLHPLPILTGKEWIPVRHLSLDEYFIESIISPPLFYRLLQSAFKELEIVRRIVPNDVTRMTAASERKLAISLKFELIQWTINRKIG